MGGGWHQDQERLKRFLNREFRQVWAVHRETGERVFLARGQADRVRAVAKKEWRCPVPGCVTEISTRGKSRRDHFFHVNGGAGHSDGESEWHLQAKAMVADWAAVRGQASVTVREEETVKHAAKRVHRRADAMARWVETGRKVAFEVEYKAFTAEAWATKHAEYTDQGIGCAWLFGHTNRYLNLARRPTDWPEDKAWDRVKWTPLTSAVAEAGLPVLFVNPIERTIGTLVQFGSSFQYRRDRYWWKVPDDYGPRLALPSPYDWDYEDLPQVIIDSVDDCELDPRRGIVTPTMQRVGNERTLISEAARRDREAVEAEDRERALRDAARARERALRDVEKAKEWAERDALMRRQQQKRDDALAAHCADLRQSLAARLGALPGFLEAHPSDKDALHGNPQDWTIFLFAELMRPHQGRSPVGRTFTYQRLIYALKAAGFRDGDNRTAGMREYLLRLWHAGYIDYQLDRHRMVATPITVRADLSAEPPARASDESPYPPPIEPVVEVQPTRAPRPVVTVEPVDDEPQKVPKPYRPFGGLMDGIIRNQCRRCGHQRDSARCRCAQLSSPAPVVDRTSTLEQAGVPSELAALFAAMGAEVLEVTNADQVSLSVT